MVALSKAVNSEPTEDYNDLGEFSAMYYQIQSGLVFWSFEEKSTGTRILAAFMIHLWWSINQLLSTWHSWREVLVPTCDWQETTSSSLHLRLTSRSDFMLWWVSTSPLTSWPPYTVPVVYICNEIWEFCPERTRDVTYPWPVTSIEELPTQSRSPSPNPITSSTREKPPSIKVDWVDCVIKTI